MVNFWFSITQSAYWEANLCPAFTQSSQLPIPEKTMLIGFPWSFPETSLRLFLICPPLKKVWKSRVCLWKSLGQSLLRYTSIFILWHTESLQSRWQPVGHIPDGWGRAYLVKSPRASWRSDLCVATIYFECYFYPVSRGRFHDCHFFHFLLRIRRISFSTWNVWWSEKKKNCRQIKK